MHTTHWTNDIAQSLKDEDRSDQIIALESVECLHTHGHEFLFFLLCSRREVLQQGQEELLGLIHSLGTLDHQSGRERRRMI